MPTIVFTLNGHETAVEVAADDLLAHVLRDRLGLTGVKLGCEEGECGTCTVLIDGVATLSCLYPAARVAGRQVTTIEGLTPGEGLGVASLTAGELHAIQQAFIDCFAAQCGYCTPGMIMAAKALLDQNPDPTHDQIVAAISGNLCRCTGYYQIVDAIALAARRLREEQPCPPK